MHLSQLLSLFINLDIPIKTPPASPTGLFGAVGSSTLHYDASRRRDTLSPGLLRQGGDAQPTPKREMPCNADLGSLSLAGWHSLGD